MTSNKVSKEILDLDLTAIKTKLMHTASGEGWSAARADAVELEYKRFLHLMKKFPTAQTAPRVDVDTFWHYHILDTMKYAADCEQAFGYFLHHYPYLGMEGADDDEVVRQAAGERMRDLYEATFGEIYLRQFGPAAEAGAAYCGAPPPAAGIAYCGATSSAMAAYCGATTSPKTAYCGAPPGISAAYCGAPPSAEAAYCGQPPSAGTAYCGAPPGAAAPAAQESVRVASPHPSTEHA